MTHAHTGRAQSQAASSLRPSQSSHLKKCILFNRDSWAQLGIPTIGICPDKVPCVGRFQRAYVQDLTVYRNSYSCRTITVPVLEYYD